MTGYKRSSERNVIMYPETFYPCTLQTLLDL